MAKTPRERVLERWPGAFSFRTTPDRPVHILWSDPRGGFRHLGDSPTEQTAWAAAAARLDPRDGGGADDRVVTDDELAKESR